MPIYEYYCSKCNTVFNFFSKTVNTTRKPACPACKKPRLERLISVFAMTGKAVEPGAAAMPGVDEARLERAVQALAGEAESMNSEDPRQAAKLMRKFTDMTGMDPGGKMKDALNRLEAGESPETIEAEMGDLMNGEENPFVLPGKQGKGAKKPAPRRDSTLYEL